MSEITIQLLPAADAITMSVIAVLRAHGYEILHKGRPLSSTEYALLFREFGRNAAQALVELSDATAAAGTEK